MFHSTHVSASQSRAQSASSPPALGEHPRGIAPFNRRQFPGPETIERLKPLHHDVDNELRGKGVVAAEEDLGRIDQFPEAAQCIWRRRESGVVVQALQIGDGPLRGLFRRAWDEERSPGDPQGEVGAAPPAWAKMNGMCGYLSGAQLLLLTPVPQGPCTPVLLNSRRPMAWLRGILLPCPPTDASPSTGIYNAAGNSATRKLVEPSAQVEMGLNRRDVGGIK